MLKHIGSASNAQAAIAPEPKLLRRLCQQRLEDGVGEVGRRDHEPPALVANVHSETPGGYVRRRHSAASHQVRVIRTLPRRRWSSWAGASSRTTRTRRRLDWPAWIAQARIHGPNSTTFRGRNRQNLFQQLGDLPCCRHPKSIPNTAISSREFTQQIQLLQVAQPNLAAIKIYIRVIAGSYRRIVRDPLSSCSYTCSDQWWSYR